MRDDLVPLPRHRARSGSSSPAGRRRTSSTGGARAGEYEALLRGYGLDPARPLVLVTGNTPTNTPYEARFFERLVDWWQASAGDRVLAALPAASA